MNQICKDIASYGLVPVIKIEDPEKAVPLAKALCDGGLPVAEITFRTKCAAEAIARITKEFPDMLVGAGTVLTTEQVDHNPYFLCLIEGIAKNGGVSQMAAVKGA